MKMGDSVKTIVDSIKKHIGFKRLAVYSIQSLCKKCTPPSNGWQQNAIEAFEAGAAEAISEVVTKNSGDGELFLQALVQLQACAVAGNALGLLANGSLATIVSAFRKYFAEAKMPVAQDAVRDGLILGGMYRAAGKDAEPVAVTESFLRLMAYVSLQARAEAATSAAGIAPCLLEILPRLPTPSSVRLALTALESLGRSGTGAATLANSAAVESLVTMASQLFGVDAGANTGGATPSRGQRMQAATGIRLPGSPQGSTSSVSRRGLTQMNAHLDPAFKLLDRLSRDEAGLKTLRGSPAVPSLATAVEWAQSQSAPSAAGPGSTRFGAVGLDPAIAATGVRLLARVLGNDLAALIARVAAAASSSSSRSLGGEADFAASLMASLATDPEVAGRLVNGPDNMLQAMVDLLGINGGACTSHKAAAALSSAVRRVAAHNLEFGDALVSVGAVPRVMTTARAMSTAGPGAAPALTEALTALADLLTTPDDVAAADAGGSGMAFFLSLLAERGPTDPGCAAACLAVLHACQCNGYDAGNLAAGSVVKLTLAAMSSQEGSGHLELQVVGTAVLCAAAMGSRGQAGGTEEASVAAVVQAGALNATIANLDLCTRVAPGPAAGASGSMATGGATRLLSTSAAYLGRPSLALAGNKVAQRLSLHAAAQAQETTTVGDADGDAAAAAAAAGSHPAAPLLASVSMHLLFLLTSGSTDGSATKAAKAAGLVRGMLDAYGRHSDSDAVHDAFTDLVECTTGEAELVSAIMAVARDTALLRDTMAAIDPALLAIAEADLGKEGLIVTSAAGEVSISTADPEDGTGAHAPESKTGGAKASKAGAKDLPSSIAQRVSDALCLLQAATCSARLCGIMVRAQGVPVLVRVLGIVSVVKARQDGGKGGGRGGKGKAVVLQTGGGRAGADPEAERTIPSTLQDEILVQCCATMTGLCRVAVEWGVGTLGLDPIPTSMSNHTGLVVEGQGGSSPTAASTRSKGAMATSGTSVAGHRRQRSGKTVGDVLAATQASVAAALYRPVVTRILIKTINSRTNLPGSLSAASVCVGVLSLGRVGGGVAEAGEGSALLDTIIAQGGVEAVVGGMRAHPACLPALQAVSNSLGCIAIVGRGIEDGKGTLRLPAPAETTGSAAVATRGATREIIRSLQNASAAANGSGSRWYGPAGQASLCSLLRVLLVIAETPKGADILRKQGTLEALIATLDSGSAAAEAGADDKEGGASKPGGAEKDPSSGGATIATALSGDVFGGAISSVVDGGAGKGGGAAAGPGGGAAGASALGGQGLEASELILGILSRLMDSKDLAEAVRTINATAEKIVQGGLKMASLQLTKLALTTVYSLAGKDNGVKAGGALWTEALCAITTLVSACADGADALLVHSGTPETAKVELTCRAAQALLPAASNCLAATVAFRARLDLNPTPDSEQDGADLPARWAAAVGKAVVSLVSCTQVATGVRGTVLRGLGGVGTPSAGKAVSDRLCIAFSAGTYEALSAANTMLHRDASAGAAVLVKSESTPSGPVAGLLQVISRLADDGETDTLSCALELLYSIAKVQDSGRGSDGLASILACTPPAAPVLLTALNELIATGGAGGGGAVGAGSALLLLARMAHRTPPLIAALRDGGISEPMRQALQRFCAPPPAEESAAEGVGGTPLARDVEALGAARVLEGGCLLQSVLVGFAGAGAGDTAMLVRLLTTVREEPAGAYATQAPKACTAMCEMIAASCTPCGQEGGGAGSRYISEEDATAARDACAGLDARSLIVAAMSSVRADVRLLKAGARALSSLGKGSGSGSACETRRAVARVRKAVGLVGLPGLLPDGDPDSSATDSITPGDPLRSPTGGLASPTLTPQVSSPTVAGEGGGAGGKSAPSKAPGDAMNELEAAVRTLSAALAGESSLTPAAYRYAFDTLVAAVESSTAAYAEGQSGSLVLAPSAQEGTKAHHHHGSGASGSAPASAPAGRASVRMSLALTGRPGADTPGGGRGGASPEKEQAGGAGLQSGEALLAAFLAQCSAVIATSVQGLARLASPVLVPNPCPADNSASAGTRPELAAALGLPQSATVWDATEEEVARLGEPRGTASHASAARAHEEAAMLAMTVGAPWPAATLATCPIAACVSAGELMDGLLLALGHTNTHATPSPPALAGSPVGVTPLSTMALPQRREGYTVTPQVAESVCKAITEVLSAAHKRVGPLLGAGPSRGSPRPEAPPSTGSDGTGADSSTGAEACAEVVWACSVRGLVHVLGSAQLAGIGAPCSDDLCTAMRTPHAAAGTSEREGESSSVLLAPGATRYMRDALVAILGAASEPAVAILLAEAVLGGVSVSPGSSSGSTTASASGKTPASSLSAKVKAGPASPFRENAPAAAFGFKTVSAACSIAATPVTVMLQLLLGAEAVTRPESAELARRLEDFQKSKGGEGVDSFERSSALLQHVCTGETLRTLVRRFARPEGPVSTGALSLDNSPAWLLLAQVADGAHSGGLTRLVPLTEQADMAQPARAGSLACIRVMGEVLEALLSGCAPSEAEATQAPAGDAVVLRGGLGQAAALLSTWAAAAVSAVVSEEEPSTPALVAVTPALRRSASNASATQVLGTRAPGTKPAIMPLEQLVEEESMEEEGAAAVQEEGLLHGRGVSWAGDVARGSRRLDPAEGAEAGVYRGAAQCVVYASCRLLGHMDLTLSSNSMQQQQVVSTPSGSIATDMCALLSDDASLSLFRSSLRQDRCDRLAVAGIVAMRRSLGLTAAHTSTQAGLPMQAAGLAQVEALACGGVFARVALALGLHSSSMTYSREAIRLLDDAGRSLAANAKMPGGAYTGSLLQGALGLTGGCLKALQSTVKRLGRDGGDEFIRTVGDRLVSALSDVFSSVSAKGFLDGMEKAAAAVEACLHMRGTQADGTVVYIPRPDAALSPSAPVADLSGGTTEAPPEFVTMLLRLQELQLVSTNLEPEAVPAVPGPLLVRMVAGVRAYTPDAHIAGVLAWALARACENSANHGDLVGASKAVPALVELVRWHKTDSFVAEAIASAFRPLTVHVAMVQLLKRQGIVPALVDVMASHVTTLLPKRLSYDDATSGTTSSAASKAARAAAHRKLMRKLMSPASSGGGNMGSEVQENDAEEGAGVKTEGEGAASAAAAIPVELEPRIAHYALQSLANVACDNVTDDMATIPGFMAVQQHVDRGCPGGVARLVAAGGVSVLVDVMKAHLDRPRVLEDALCAMSNVAYSCDGVRLLIGRTAAPLVVSVLRVFNGDPRTFSMALRTVGNLTRCDENIVSVVSAGVIDGIVEGMARNRTDPDVLKLAADVMGNLASIDESAVDKRAGLTQLRAGLKARAEAAALTGAALPASSSTAARLVGRDVGASPRADRLANMTSLQDAVACLLLDDGAHTGLRDAMVTHATDALVSSACLRSLQYMADSQPLVERMESEAALGKAVCQVMRSCDFDPELTVRGSLLLAQMLRFEGSGARTAALQAGAAQVLLSAVETHRVNVETFSQVLKVVQSTCAGEPAMLSAARELNAPATILSIMAEAGRGLTESRPLAPGAGAGGANARLANASMRGVGLADTLASIMPERALVIARQAILLLTTWASKDVGLADKMALQAARTLAVLLMPPVAELADSAPPTPYSDAPLVEASLCLLSPCACSSTTMADALARDGSILRLLSPLPCFLASMDRAALAQSALAILGACGSASPASAFATLEANGHGVAQGLAVHWGLKMAVEEAVRKGVYDAAGGALAAMFNTSLPARREREAKAKAEAAVAEAAVPSAEGAPVGSSARTNRSEVAQLTPRSRAKDDKAYAAAEAAREKEAAKICTRTGLPLSSVLESRAGLIPWSLFPRPIINQLAGGGEMTGSGGGKASDVPIDVWFLPDMAPASVVPKVKARRMRLSVSEDLRVLSWAYTSRRVNKVLDWVLPLASVRDVRPGMPAPTSTSKLKKPILALRGPNPARGIVLESDTAALLHMETGAGEEHDKMIRALAVLVQYARARAGVPEPLPELDAEVVTSVQVATPLPVPVQGQGPLEVAALTVETRDIGGPPAGSPIPA